MFENKLEVLREWVKDLNESGKIRLSKFTTTSPILLVPKALAEVYDCTLTAAEFTQ
jgi:hypothetical protein